jgi:hypothetical protein
MRGNNTLDVPTHRWLGLSYERQVSSGGAELAATQHSGIPQQLHKLLAIHLGRLHAGRTRRVDTGLEVQQTPHLVDCNNILVDSSNYK